MLFLVGDVGATKTLLGIYRNLECIRQERYTNGNFSSLEEIIATFLASEKIDKACFGVAGPVIDQISHLTNLPWIIDSAKIAKRFHIPRVTLLNDMVAHAYGINEQTPLFTLHHGEKREGNRCLIAAGTGLGEVPIFFDGTSFHPSPSEGGRTDFSPRNQREMELFFYLKKKFGHVSWEKVLSGLGIVNLYHFLIETGHFQESPAVKKQMEKEDPAKVIATEKRCPACVETLRWFCSLYGAEAANLALKTFAIGGVYVGGGIAPQILEVIKSGDFLSGFFDKGDANSLIKRISIHIILEINTALTGSAYYCYKK